MTAKDLRVAPISRTAAADLIRAVHYSHSTVNNSQLNLGVFLGTRLEGAMMFGPPLDRRKLLTLVEGTPWNGMLELNRMAFSEQLPRNSESRAIAVAMRMIRREYPHIQWIVSFADATRCGDGTIYRAAGFVLTGIKKNATIWGDDKGRLITNVGVRTSQKKIQQFAHGSAAGYKGAGSMDHYKDQGFKPLPGFQLRYLYFVNPAARARLTVPILPYSAIEVRGAAMYKGKRVGSETVDTAVLHTEEGGSTPTPTLQSNLYVGGSEGGGWIPAPERSHTSD